MDTVPERVVHQRIGVVQAHVVETHKVCMGLMDVIVTPINGLTMIQTQSTNVMKGGCWETTTTMAVNPP